MRGVDLPAPRLGFYIANVFTSARCDTSSRVLRSRARVFDLSAKRELNNGFGNSLSTAVELVVSPILFGVIGWRLDAWVGTSPVFTLALFAFTLGYVVWKQYVTYSAKMDRQQHELLAPKRDRPAA